MSDRSVRVLVGIGDERGGRELVRRAAPLLPAGADCTIVSVVRPIPVAGLATPALEPLAASAATTDVWDEVVDEARRAVEAVAAALPAPTSTEVVLGEPGAQLCDLAAAMHADLVVVGSQGLGVVSRIILGSVSDHVVHHAPCPVLVVRLDQP